MSDQDLFSILDGFSLSFESAIRVKTIDNPLTVVGIAGVQWCFLETGNCREDRVRLRCAAKLKYFIMQVLICDDLYFLPETN